MRTAETLHRKNGAPETRHPPCEKQGDLGVLPPLVQPVAGTGPPLMPENPTRHVLLRMLYLPGALAKIQRGRLTVPAKAPI